MSPIINHSASRTSLRLRSLLTRLACLTACLAPFPAANASGWPSAYGGVMLQGFYWDSQSETKWTQLTAQAPELAGYFDIIWIPNAGKAGGAYSMGYDPMYWFEDYNSSFGNESELRTMVQTLKNVHINVVGDVVLNHRIGVTDWGDLPTETWNGTSYPLGADCICSTDEWAANGGNPTGAPDEGDDFNGARDLDHTNAKVQAACKAYCKFLLEDLGYAGFRLDMVKGYSPYYTNMYNAYSRPRFSVGEYWDGYDNITRWISSTGFESAAFDFPFKYAINSALAGGDYSALCWMADGWNPQPAGLVHYDTYKRYAVTFIDNHDTWRDNSNKFSGDVVAANAFLLSMPGTPCVFYPHWRDYKADIRSLIAIRKAVGVTNTSAVNVLSHTSSCFMAEVIGTYGKLAVKFGPDMATPSGYSDAQIKASGNNWCIWATVDVSASPQAVDGDPFTVYWDNSSAQWATPTLHYFGGTAQSTWPGVAMTLVEGTSATYSLTVPSGTTGLVFNNGAGAKTDDLTALPAHLYGPAGDKGLYTGESGSSSGSGTSTGGTAGPLFPSALYAVGTLQGHTWDPASPEPLQGSGTTYSGIITLVAASGDTYAYFNLIQKTGSWNEANTLNRYGALTSNALLTPGTPATLKVDAKCIDPGASYSWKTTPGTYLITIDFSTLQVTLTPPAITLSKTTLALDPDATATLRATVTPDAFATANVTWTSSDPAVATVSTTGKVTALAIGTATITATYATATATCTVHVGKTRQEILWTQELGTLPGGATANLTATASSGLPVTYTIISGNNVAHITGTTLYADSPGVATIRATQPGNDTYAPADALTKTLYVTLGYTPGDVDGDGTVTLADVRAIIAHILEETPTPFNAAAADLNGDTLINVADAALTLRLIP